MGTFTLPILQAFQLKHWTQNIERPMCYGLSTRFTKLVSLPLWSSICHCTMWKIRLFNGEMACCVKSETSSTSLFSDVVMLAGLVVRMCDVYFSRDDTIGHYYIINIWWYRPLGPRGSCHLSLIIVIDSTFFRNFTRRLFLYYFSRIDFQRIYMICMITFILSNDTTNLSIYCLLKCTWPDWREVNNYSELLIKYKKRTTEKHCNNNYMRPRVPRQQTHNICITQRRRWSNNVQTFYKCFVFAWTTLQCKPEGTICLLYQ